MKEVEAASSGFTQQQTFDGIEVSEIIGGKGPIDFAFVYFTVQGLPDGEEAVAFMYPPSAPECYSLSYTNSGDDKLFGAIGNGINASFRFTKAGSGAYCSFWETSIRQVLATSPYPYSGVTLTLGINATVFEPSDFDPDLIAAPQNLDAGNPSWDPDNEKGLIDLTFTYENEDDEDPTSLAILRDDGSGPEFVGYIPWEDGVTAYAYTDIVNALGEYTYTIQAYKYADEVNPNIISPPSNEVIVNFSSSLPDIDMIGDLVLTITLSSVVVFITDPSGIYTLIPGKTHDTLYNRDPTITSIDVKIPDPFVKIAFIP